jgi:hypothetical protein
MDTIRHKVGTMTRSTRGAATWVACFTAICLVGPLRPTVAADLKDIASAFGAHRRALDSILVECEIRGKALVDEALLYEKMKVINPPFTDSRVVAKGPKAYARSISTMRDINKYFQQQAKKGQSTANLPAKALLQALDAMPRNKWEEYVVYDGSMMWQKATPAVILDQSHDSLLVEPPAKQPYRTIPITYLDHVCLMPVDPSVDDPRQAAFNRIPEMFEVAKFTLTNDVVVDGAPCVLLEAPEYQRLWLDPKLGFAVRKREMLEGKGVAMSMQFSEFAELVPGVWLPHRIEQERIGTSQLPESYVGKPIIRTTIRVTKIEANKPEHETYFKPKPKPGSFVNDARLKPIGSDGKPVATDKPVVIGYIQPASDEDLDEVIRAAEKGAGMRIEQSTTGHQGDWWIIGANIIIFVGVMLLIAWRISHAARSRKMARGE